MTIIASIFLAVWLAKGAGQICAGFFQILAGLAAGLCGALLLCLALPVQAIERLWRTAFPSGGNCENNNKQKPIQPVESLPPPPLRR